VDSRRLTDQERRWELELPAEVGSPRRARELVYLAAEAWGQPELGLAAGLCATELVTNVLVHTHCQACRLVVRYESDWLYIEVHDDSPMLPAKSSEPPEAEHGRGLQIVDAVASEWGVAAEVHSGKSVWVRLTVDPEENS
jgi:serine/threonine-protein kinase RsbW